MHTRSTTVPPALLLAHGINTNFITPKRKIEFGFFPAVWTKRPHLASCVKIIFFFLCIMHCRRTRIMRFGYFTGPQNAF